MEKMEKLTVSGVPVYTSDELKNILKRLIDQNGQPTSKKLLIKLIDNGVLTPVINEPSKIKQLMMKIKQQQPLTGIYGVSIDGTCYVVFSPRMTGEKAIQTALHEIVHVSHQQHPHKFHKLNLNIYVQFYSHYYKELFEAKTFDKKLFADFIRTIIKDSMEYRVHSDTYVKILPKAFEKHTALPEQQFKQRVYFVVNTVFQKIRSRAALYRYNIAGAFLERTYRHMFQGVDYTSGLGQELYAPGEIIAILSTIKPDHPNVIKSLKMITPGKKPVINSQARIKIIK